MTATDTKPATQCRRCNAPIRPSDLCIDPRTMSTVWVDEAGWDSCEGTADSHQPAAVCRVHDEIVLWVDKDGRLNIREGDLILRDYRLELVERLYYKPADNILVRYELAGHNAASWAQPSDLVAVRRYIAEETDHA